MKNKTLQVHSINYQRNGISGNGFHVVHFDWNNSGEECKNMVATVFYEEKYCGVICLDDLTQAWRGDYFEDALRKAIKEYDEAQFA